MFIVILMTILTALILLLGSDCPPMLVLLSPVVLVIWLAIFGII